jgi:4-amino-4-deoxy-L-arabinose transferase-like glycosyltransferase
MIAENQLHSRPGSDLPSDEPRATLTRIETAIAPWCQSPSRLLASLVALHALLWVIVPTIVHQAPPIDVVEGYMWGREWVLATYKHPAMPSWLIEGSRILTGGGIGWPVYIVAQLFVAATLAIVFSLGRDLMDAPRAAAGAISLMAVEYLSWMSPQFNHNIAQLPFWVGAVWCAWRAVEASSGRGPKSGRFVPTMIWWIALGLTAGIGLYAKFTHGLILVIIAGWMLFDADARRTLVTPGPWLAVAVAALVSAPLLHWLIGHDFQPMTYAAGRGADPIKGSFLVFLPSIMLIALPILLLAAATGTFGAPWDLPRRADGGPQTVRRARDFLAIMTLAPIVALMLTAIFKGGGLRASWTAPMLMLLGPAAIMLRSMCWDRRALMRQVAYAVPILIIVPLLYGISMAVPVNDRGKPVRVAWPAKTIAERFAGIWSKETGQPLKLVAGEAWLAGLVGIPHPDRPSVFTDADLTISPWVTETRAKREGVLLLWETRTADGLPATMRQMIGTRAVRTEKFAVRGGRGDPSIELAYVIIPPSP